MAVKVERLASGAIYRVYESTTGESNLPIAPTVFYDDFLGADTVIPSTAESGCKWLKKIVGAAPPTVGKKADQAGGAVELALTSDSQKQDAVLYFGDQREFLLTDSLIFEARIKLSILPTLVAEAVWGLCGDWADGPDAITYSTFFAADGSGLVTCEMDDAATDSSTSSATTLTTADWAVCRIDATTITDIKFYIDGSRVASGTTYSYAATGANATLQPYFAMYKASGAGVGTMLVDSVRVMTTR